MNRPRRPPAVAPGDLEKAALKYLERFSSSAENLRRVLMRKILRAAHAGIIERAEGSARVDAVVERLVVRGLIDDRAYAEGRARSLSRQGRSRARIGQSLAAKGVEAEEIEGALRGLAEDGETDLAAAARFAKRRRLGPFRAAKERTVRRDRDIAALGRAGFAFAVARQVIDAEDSEALAALIADV
jgi:regulatory protein